MKAMFLSHQKPHKSLPIYFVNIFFSFHYAVTIYVSSSFLGTFFSPQVVSLFFIVGALGNILLFLGAPYILRKIGNRKFLFYLLALESLATIGLALAYSALSVGIFFILRGSVIMLVYYSLDIFLEEISAKKKIGGIRGLYLTITNLAIAASPLLVAKLTLGNNFSPLYWLSALALVPPLFLALFSFHNKPVHPRHTEPKILPFSLFWKSKNIRRVSLASLTLELFYVFMVIYTPIYLNKSIGFAWSEIGVMFTIMLLPFVLFELPVGYLTDKKYGEKEIMSIGFFIIGIALITIPFLDKDFIWWTVLLFISRTGASLVEITTESYFFKHVDSRDTGLISLYRLGRPVAVIIGAGLFSITISIFSYGPSFFVLALIIFYGLLQSFYLKDIR